MLGFRFEFPEGVEGGGDERGGAAGYVPGEGAEEEDV